MAVRRRRTEASSLVVSPDRPLVGIVQVEDGQEAVRYFADEADADAATAQDATEEARSLSGVWADLDWEEAVEEFERIHQENEPTPPKWLCPLASQQIE
jgi:hypothetical protein